MKIEIKINVELPSWFTDKYTMLGLMSLVEAKLHQGIQEEVQDSIKLNHRVDVRGFQIVKE